MTDAVTVKKLDETSFEVMVQGRTATTHIVTVSTQYVAKLTAGKVATEVLVSRSFDFLLEREPNTSILRRFDLPLIGQYFPEYERTIVKMLD
ncbi:MAG: hypothetical protein K8Q92_01230 [Methylophilales bacterium]|nr:hypothetical protein [Methylophilales bacterium]